MEERMCDLEERNIEIIHRNNSVKMGKRAKIFLK